MNINYQKISDSVYGTLAKDKDFKAKFLKDPRKMIKEVSGEEVPKDIKIEVYESKENDLHFLI